MYSFGIPARKINTFNLKKKSQEKKGIQHQSVAGATPQQCAPLKLYMQGTSPQWFLDCSVDEGDDSLIDETFRRHCFEANRPAIFRRSYNLQFGGSQCFNVQKLQNDLSPKSLLELFGCEKNVPIVRETQKPGDDTSVDAKTTEEAKATPAFVNQSKNSPLPPKDYCPLPESSSTLQRFITDVTRDGEIDAQVYLKDWHYLLDRSALSARNDDDWDPHTNALYTCPLPLRLDWLNEYCLRKTDRSRAAAAQPTEDRSNADEAHAGGMANNRDLFGKQFDARGDNTGDYRFVYIGEVGSSTPYHMDVFGSYSWSLNVGGTKRWRFYTPHPDEEMPNTFLEFSEDEIGRPITRRYVEVIQLPGDLVFVPSRVYHCVENTTANNEHLVTSVNHNWFNRFNIVTHVVPLLVEEAMAAHTSVDQETRDIFRNDAKRAGCDCGLTTANYLTNECASLARHDFLFQKSISGEGEDVAIAETVTRDGWLSHVELMLQGGGSWNLFSMRRLLCFVADERRAANDGVSNNETLLDPAADLRAALEGIRQIDIAIGEIATT